MPSPNGLGQILAGVAGFQSSIDGRLIPVLGGAQWLTDALVVGQSLDASTILLIRASDGAIVQTLATHGASTIVAGGGRWASFLEPIGDGPSQLDGALGALSGGYLYAAGPDGTIAWKRVYQDPAGLTLSSPTATIELPSANPRDVQVLSSTEAVWSDAPGVYGAIGRAVPQPAVLTEHYRLVTTPDGVDWLIVQGQNGGLCVHPDGDPHGYVLVPVGQPAYNADVALVHGELFVTWAVINREIWGDVRSATVDRSNPRINLAAPDPVVFAFSHPVLVAPFKDPQGRTAAPAEIVVNQTGQTANRPYFVASDSLGGPFAGTRLGVYTEAPYPTADILANQDTRVLVCHDAPDAFPVATLAELRPWDLPLLELYLEVGETLQQSTVRWTQNLSDLLADWPGDVGVDLMFYCEGGAPPNELFTVAQVLDGLRLLSNLVNASPRVKLIACFEYERANGITGHPELADAFTSLLAAASAAGLAALTPIGEPTSAPLPSPAPVPGPDPVSPPEPVRPVVLTPYPAAHVYTSKGSL